jgi:predicted component of type VI protein secretion system
MHTLLIVGYDAATCGWVLPQRGAGALRQAVIFRLDDALWITPFDRQSTVTFNSQRLQFEYFVRLRNGMTLRIDGHEFLVEPWKQWFERD